MTSQEKSKIMELSENGLGYSKIATMLGLPVNTVKSYIRRRRNVKNGVCLLCGAKLKITPGVKQRRFCSDTCRMQWWNAHRLEGNKKAFYTAVCAYCGREFQAFSTSNRKYCSRGCFADARRKLR